MSEALILHYQQVESQKANPTRKTPKLLKLASGFISRELTGSDLEDSQIVVDPYLIGGKVTPTFEIFERVGSTKAIDVADAIPYLMRTGSEPVQAWLSALDSSLEQLILGRDCPALITSQARWLVVGNIPDGNHRALGALLLHSRGERVVLPSLEMQISPSLHLLYNTFQFATRFSSNPRGTISILNERSRA